MDQVEALLGAPNQVETDHGLTFWGYAAEPNFSAPRVVFDRTQLVDSWMTPPTPLEVH